jgi:hypothetical protein
MTARESRLYRLGRNASVFAWAGVPLGNTLLTVLVTAARAVSETDVEPDEVSNRIEEFRVGARAAATEPDAAEVAERLTAVVIELAAIAALVHTPTPARGGSAT